MSSLEDLGNAAYQKALFNDYKEAVSILDKAIARFPHDKRLYNNRCYCYCKLKDYKSALSEADFMIKEFPGYLKGFYRKAEIYIEMKKYREAETVLSEILKYDPNCKEAKYLLSEVQIMTLCNGGLYSVHDAIRALELTDNSTANARAFLASGGMKGAKSNDVYYSDDEEEPSVAGAVAIATNDIDYSPYTDPSNPFNSYSIWVGNVTKKITEEKIKPLFSKYGKIKNIIVQHQNFCAFVNYAEPSMASMAMKKFPQKYPLEDTFLIIRFPDNAKSTVANLGKRNGIKIK